MPAPHAERRDRVRRDIAARGIDAALITRLVNVRYLTGFTGSNAALLLTADGELLATDGRYTTQAAEQAPGLDLVVDRACARALIQRAAAGRVATLAFEAHHVTVEQLDELTGIDGAPELVPLGHLVEELRVVKDEQELALLRRACAISDEALTRTLAQVSPGRTEREIAVLLERTMIELGADCPAFDTIVATGPHSAIPHHRPTERPVERGDLLKLDFGARYRGYHADCTRTVVVGAPPAAWQQEIHDLVRQAQQAGRAAARAGARIPDVDAAARRVIAEAGYGEQFPHGLGHGVGLEIHEAPLLGYTATGRLQACTPLTVEPGVYLPGRGGVRIEDTLVVGDGEPELLTTTPRDLLVL